MSTGADQPPMILVVDDDEAMRSLLARLLGENGYRVEVAAHVDEAQEKLANHDVQLMLLDVMMPGKNGFDLCRELRAEGRHPVPVIMISARGAEADRVAGLELGADDYISKPFGQSEVIARVRAVLRRVDMAGGPARATTSDSLYFAGFRLDQRRRELFSASGAAIILSAGEYDMLANLVAHPQQIVSRETLLELSRFRVPGSSDRSVDVMISRLRGKLGDGNDEPLIRTVRGHGYILTADVVAG